jgi:hypothetical protein
MYGDYLKEKFPQDEKNGLYVFPKLPATKLGKALVKETRISSPNDVIALHVNDGTFSSSMVIFTREKCYYEGGAFLLEDIKEVQEKGKSLTVFVNQKGDFVPHEFKVKNEQVARTLRKVLEGISSFDPTAEKAMEKTYEGFSNTELDWLNLRDEIMRTIDMLYDRYNDGKLSMIEYEEKKEELLRRL